MKARHVSFTLLLVALLATTALARKWTSAGGTFSVEGDFVEVSGDNVKLKRKDNGKVIEVLLEKLSAGDRAFIDQQQKAAKKKREAAAKALAKARAKELDKLLNPLPPQRGRGSVWGNGNGGYLGAGIKDYFAGSKLTFGNNEFSITLAAPGTLYEGGSDRLEGWMKIDPTKKPKQIDLTFTGFNQAGTKLVGIYEVTDGGLKMYLSSDPKSRPAEFGDGKGNIEVSWSAVETKLPSFDPSLPR